MKPLLLTVLIVLLVRSSAASGLAASASADADTATTIHLPNYLKSGTGRITGTLTFDSKLFGRISFAHEEVYLDPATAYNEKYVQGIADDYNSSKITPHVYDSSVAQYNRHVMTDSEGRFAFDNLPVGTYFLNANTFYQTTSTRIDHQVVYGQTWDGRYETYNNDREKLKVHSEIDVVGAVVKLDAAEAFDLASFHLMGSHICCDGEF